MIARKLGLSVLIPAALLALVALFSITQTASAETRDKDPVRGGFMSEALPSEPAADKKDGPGLQAGVMGTPVLPGSPREQSADETPRADEPRDEAQKNEGRDEGPQDEGPQVEGPRNKRLGLTIPKMGMKDFVIGSSTEQSYLDQQDVMHLAGTGFPWEEDSNTYIAGHAIGYPGGRLPYAFYDLKDLRKGDKITLRDSRGETYDYRVYERMIVDPSAFWVTQPVKDKDIVTLQTCWPEPTFEQRLIVRAERV